MNKKRIIYFIGIGIIICLITSFLIYSNSNSYIESQDWKYVDGAHIGDVIQFNSERLTEKTIYRNNEILGKIVFCYGKTLIIKNITTGEKGYYSKKKL